MRKDGLLSEKAQKKALQSLLDGDAFVSWGGSLKTVIEVVTIATDRVLAQFDLRDCYRLRQPLRGIKKALRKAIAPRGKRK